MDITFCTQHECKKKESCRRYQLALNKDNWGKRQSVFAVNPCKDNTYKLYWEIEKHDQ